MNRRELLITIGASMALAGTSRLLTAPKKAAKPLKILMLGGTGFLGPHTVRHALESGHEITLFNRGRTNADLFPDLETIIGNRDPNIDDGLAGLKGRSWDAVIDTSGYVPRIVGASASLLADHVNQYLFVSTICQYDNWLNGPPMRTESVARSTLEDPTTEDVGTHYCALKGYSEAAAEEAMPGRVTQIRPGLIVGPRDNTDRFTYWPVRISRGGKVLAPGKPNDQTQYIDARDLAAFMVHSVEQGLTGSYNTVCAPMAFGDLLDTCVAIANPKADLTWVPADFLAEQDIQAWRDLALWADSESDLAGSLTWSSEKALRAGLRIRPLEETVRDTLAWYQTLPEERRNSLRFGLSRERENEVLEAWAEQGP